MNAHTERRSVAGPVGALEVAVDRPLQTPLGHERSKLAVICHPHPLHGGTMDNKVVHTLARAFVQAGWTAVRFNFRGVGASTGTWDEGRGEVDDGMAVLQASMGWFVSEGHDRASADTAGQSTMQLALAGFSFGGYVASQLAERWCARAAGMPESMDQLWPELILVAPATQNFPMAAVSSNTLLIHGESDEVVPLQSTLDWARPAALPITVVPGAGHFFHGQLPLLKRLVLRHLGVMDSSSA